MTMAELFMALGKPGVVILATWPGGMRYAEGPADVRGLVKVVDAWFSGFPGHITDVSWGWSVDLPPDHADAFLDLARADREADFLALAGALGIPAADHAPMWAGTRRRLGR